MCGICGFNWADKVLIKNMVKVLRHRGPNQEGFVSDSGISLGHTRLSIIDLNERGKQPMFSSEGDISIVFNGEIYNYLDLRNKLEKKYSFASKTDTEVLIYGYVEWGIKGLLDRIEGMFAFGLYDYTKKRLFLARDHLGKKPLYYYSKRNEFVFASEIKAIIEHKDIKRKVNYQALNQYMTRRFSTEDQTMFDGIKKVMPGHYLELDIQKTKFKITKYWDININKKTRESPSQIKKNIKSLYNSALQKRLMSDVPLGVFLSGGIDSSIIASSLSKLTNEPIKTFSAGFIGDNISNELPLAKRTAQVLGADHHEVKIDSNIIKELPDIVWHLDEPMADPAAIPNYVLSREAKKKVTVILTGDGGDEGFAGYDQYKFMKKGKILSYFPGVFRSSIPLVMKHTPSFIMNRLYKYSSSTGDELITRLKRFLEDPNNKSKSFLEIVSIFDEKEREQLFSSETLENIGKLSNYRKINEDYFSSKRDVVTQASYYDIKSYLPEDLLMKPDKMGMAFGIEARAPFLDKNLIEYGMQIPAKEKMNLRASKIIMRNALKNHIPKHILKIKKQTFNVPIDIWMENDLMKITSNVLDENKKINKKYFNLNEINRIKSSFPRSKLFYARQMWNILNFDLWHSIYIDRDKRSKII